MSWLDGRARNIGCPHSRWKLAWAFGLGNLRDGRFRHVLGAVWSCLFHTDDIWQAWREVHWKHEVYERPGYLLARRILDDV